MLFFQKNHPRSLRVLVPAVVCCLLCMTGVVFGHAGWDAKTDARLFPDRLQLVIRMMPTEAWKILKENAPPGLDEAALNAAVPLLEARGGGLYEVRAGDELLKAGKIAVTLERNGQFAWLVDYPAPTKWPVRVKPLFAAAIGPDFKATISVYDQTKPVFPGDLEPIGGGVQTGHDLTFELPRPAAIAEEKVATVETAPQPLLHPPAFPEFLHLGIRHILTGYDHLLFLIALLAGCRSVRSMLAIITGFTLAHSLTLGLAAMNIVRMKSAVVEPLIAASIVFVGVENFFRKSTGKGRWQIAGVFGLVHGFGFAGALREAGLGANGSPVLVPLFSFNLGVEIGQLAVAALVLPLLLALRKSPAGERYAMPALSSLVILAGGWWLLERTLLAA